MRRLRFSKKCLKKVIAVYDKTNTYVYKSMLIIAERMTYIRETLVLWHCLVVLGKQLYQILVELYTYQLWIKNTESLLKSLVL